MSNVSDRTPNDEFAPAPDEDEPSPHRIEHSPALRDGRCIVTMYDTAGLALHIDTGSLSSDTFRTRFTKAAIERNPQLEALREWITGELTRLAGEQRSEAPAHTERIAAVADPAPWETEVDGAELLHSLADLLRRYVALDESAIRVTALWALGTWCMDAFDLYPRLCLTSPERQCGKSTLLEVLAAIVRRPIKADQTSEAALFRTIDRDDPTVLLDECDQWFAGRDRGDMVATINGGHTRSGTVYRCVGDDHEPRPFKVFCPMALSGIGKLPETTASRCISIPLRRKLPDENVARLRIARLHRETAELRQRCQRWGLDAAADVRSAIESEGLSPPEHGSDRDIDNAEPLLAVAVTAGGTWLSDGMSALSQTFEAAALDDEGSKTEQLLTDIRDAFERSASDVLSSAQLVKLLIEDEDGAWAGWNRGQPIRQHQLARWLRPFGIRPEQIRFPGNLNRRGYRREWFEDAFSRYL